MELKTPHRPAIEEYDKVIQIKKKSSEEFERVSKLFNDVEKKIKSAKLNHIDQFTSLIAELRAVRGEAISLKELRYIDIPSIEAYEEELEKQNENLSSKCVAFLLKKEALLPYSEKVEELQEAIEGIKKVAEANEMEQKILSTSKELELLIDVVGNLKIEDATKTTAIIDHISEIYSSFNRINASLKQKRKELRSHEGKAEFAAPVKISRSKRCQLLGSLQYAG